MKKLISIVLVVILALSVMPLAYAAEPDAHVHSVSNDCATTDGEQITFKPLSKAILGEYERLGGGNYYLIEDIVLEYGLEIFNDANICLNGYTISTSREYVSGHAYPVLDSQGGVLSVCDCQGNGKISATNVGIFARGDAVNMYDIKIFAYASGVYVSDGATFNMYAGSIYSENYGIDSRNENNVINLYDGIIGADDEAVSAEFGGKVNNYGTEICNDMCHSKGIMKFFWKIILFFNKLMLGDRVNVRLQSVMPSISSFLQVFQG